MFLNLSAHVVGKAWVPKKIVDPIMENVTLEPELEEALASASDAELCDIAGNTRAPTHISSQGLLVTFSLIFHQIYTMFYKLFLCFFIKKFPTLGRHNFFNS